MNTPVEILIVGTGSATLATAVTNYITAIAAAVTTAQAVTGVDPNQITIRPLAILWDATNYHGQGAVLYTNSGVSNAKHITPVEILVAAGNASSAAQAVAAYNTAIAAAVTTAQAVTGVLASSITIVPKATLWDGTNWIAAGSLLYQVTN